MNAYRKWLLTIPAALLLAAGSALAAPGRGPGGGGPRGPGGPRGGPGPGVRVGGPGPGVRVGGPGPAVRGPGPGVRVGGPGPGVRVGGPGPAVGVRIGGPGPGAAVRVGGPNGAIRIGTGPIGYGTGGYYGPNHRYPYAVPRNNGGFYAGLGVGVGLSYLNGLGTGYGGYSQPIVINSSPNYVVPAEPVPVPTDAPPSEAPAATETALQIAEVNSGPASDAGFQRGDVMFKINGQRVQTFDQLRGILTAAPNGKIAVTYWDPATGKVGTKDVAVQESRIGVSVVEVPVVLDN